MLHILFSSQAGTTESKPSDLSEEDSAFLDFCLDLGKMCWQTFIESPPGKVLVSMLPSDTVRVEAKRLFLVGFGARLFLCPPVGPKACDMLLGPIACRKAWKEYLGRSDGQTILDGKPYPETDESILAVANHFFKMGFEAGTVAAREFMKN